MRGDSEISVYTRRELAGLLVHNVGIRQSFAALSVALRPLLLGGSWDPAANPLHCCITAVALLL